MSSGFSFRNKGRNQGNHNGGNGNGNRKNRSNFTQNNTFQSGAAAPSPPPPRAFEASQVVATDPSRKIEISQELDTALGPLFAQSSGFSGVPHAPRALPKYLLEESRQLVPITFIRDDWDAANQQKFAQLEHDRITDLQGLYEDFQKLRDIERKEMERRGLVHAEDAPMVLGNAIVFRGTCLDMCPTYERVRRALENNVKKAERDPQTGRISRDRAIKAFSRPAAGQPPPLPSDVRPPHILVSTLDYLIQNFIHALPEAHSFIWDRTRSIRQDFTYQNYYGPEAIDCNERIVRIHLVCLHMMTQSENDYSQQQELEQMNKALRTLMEIYDDVRQRGGSCPNEAEFRAYTLLSHFRDPSWERELQSLPRDICQNPVVQRALKFRSVMAQNNLAERGVTNTPGAANLFHEFFRLLADPTTPFLVACLLETHVNEIRFYATKAMARSYHSKGKAYPAERFVAMLGFNDIDEVVKFCDHWEIGTNGGVELVGFKLKSFKDKPKQTQAWCRSVNEKVGYGSSLVGFINSGLSNDDLHLGEYMKKSERGISSQTPSNGLQASGFQATSNTSQAPVFSQTPDSTAFSSNQTSSALPSVLLQASDAFSIPAASGGFSQAPSNPVPGFSFLGALSFSQTPRATTSLAFTQTSTASSNAPVTSTHPTEINVLSGPPQPAYASTAQSSSTAPTFSFTKSTGPTAPKLQVATNTPSPSSFGKLGTTPPPAPLSLGKQTPAETSVKGPETPATSFTTSSPLASVSKQPKSAPSLPKTTPKLVSLPKFTEAANKLIDQLLLNGIQTQTRAIVKTVVAEELQMRKKERLVSNLSEELFRAFMDEFIYISVLESQAESFRDQHAKTKISKLLKQQGARCLAKSVAKQKRREEVICAMKFGAPSTAKRRRKTNPNASTGNISVANGSFSAISNVILARREKTRIDELWKPLDLVTLFIRPASNNFTLDIALEQRCVTGIVDAKDWSSSSSRWLATKLGMVLESHNFVRTVQNGKLKLEISTKKDYSNAVFVVFDCGISSTRSKELLLDVLEADAERLAVVQQNITQSRFRVHLLVLYWDATNSRRPTTEVLSRLKADKVSLVSICDMSMADNTVDEASVSGADVNERLQNCFKTLGEKCEPVPIEQESRPERSKMASPAELQACRDALSEKEDIERAKQAEDRKKKAKLAHLERHMSGYSPAIPMRSSGFSANSSKTRGYHSFNSFTAPKVDLSYSDQSFLPHGDSSLLCTGAPEKSSDPIRPKSSGLSKNLLELKALTAGIRSRRPKS